MAEITIFDEIDIFKKIGRLLFILKFYNVEDSTINRAKCIRRVTNVSNLAHIFICLWSRVNAPPWKICDFRNAFKISCQYFVSDIILQDDLYQLEKAELVCLK
jgi:hypothetical protein